jgi:hypothetical protein
MAKSIVDTFATGVSNSPYPEAVINRPNIYTSMGGELGFRNAFTVYNLNGRRYYSSIDAAILFNGEIVDEIVQIQWAISEQTMPLFGYNSYVWDEIAKGSRIIQGTFAINFVVPDYLNMILEKSIKDGSFKNTGRKVEPNKHSPMYANSFSIGIGYGSKDDITGDTPCIILENVVIQYCGQALDTQGANLVEMYQFIARDRSYSR